MAALENRFGKLERHPHLLARLRLDSGPTLLLRGANVSLAEDGSVTVASGDVFVDVLAGDASTPTYLTSIAAAPSDYYGEGSLVINGPVAPSSTNGSITPGPRGTDNG